MSSYKDKVSAISHGGGIQPVCGIVFVHSDSIGGIHVRGVYVYERINTDMCSTAVGWMLV